jgi:hypothetical protein
VLQYATLHILAIFGLTRGDLEQVLGKLQNICEKKVVSKVVTLVIPVEKNGKPSKTACYGCFLHD